MGIVDGGTILMSKYAIEQQDVLEAITEDGGDVVFPGAIPGTPPAYNELTGVWTGGTDATDVTGKALQIEDDPMRFQGLGLVTSNPITLLIAAKNLGIRPVPGMVFRFGGTTYTIANGGVEALDPAGDGPIYYDVVGSA